MAETVANTQDEIATFADTKALVILRFDRLRARDGRLIRLPQEESCLKGLLTLYRAGPLDFSRDHSGMAEAAALTAWPTPFRKSEWVFSAKPPFGGPEAVLSETLQQDLTATSLAITSAPPL